MRTVFAVTGDALGRRIAVLVAGFVTIRALEAVMFSDQWKVGCLVLECRLIERHDIGVAPLVVSVAIRAIPAFRIPVPAMESFLRGNIRRNFLMTLTAEFGLFIAFKLDVARSTFFLDVGMTGNHFARHNQRLELGFCVFGGH